MACFIATATEAAVVHVIAKVQEKKEATEQHEEIKTASRISISDKMKWLRNMLAGGSFLLAFEHIWHGEVVAWFPFLTAMATKEETIEMLKEMATSGIAMTLVVTLAWGILMGFVHEWEKKSLAKSKEV